MRKVTIYSLAVCLALAQSAIPANAIFGLSKCEKANKAIIKEEAIGVALWKDFNKYRKNLVGNASITMREYYDATIKLEPVLESDLKIYKSF